MTHYNQAYLISSVTRVFNNEVAMMNVRRILKNMIARRPLTAYRIKRLKQAAVVAKQAFSGVRPFEQVPVTVLDTKQAIARAKAKGASSAFVFSDSPTIVRYCNEHGIAARLEGGGKFIEPELKGDQMPIYAVNKYSNGAALAHWFFNHAIPYIAVAVVLPSSILSEDRNAETAITEAWEKQLAEGWDKFDLHVGGDFENIFQMIQATKNVPGVYLEVGVFMGSSADAALRYMTKIGLKRRCVFMDLFNDFAYDEAKESADIQWVGTHQANNQELTTSRLMPFNRDKLDVEVVRANICEPRALDGIDQICCANVDVDLFEAIIAAADGIIPKLSEGGVLLIEDAGHGPSLVGARVAVDNILEKYSGLFHFQTFSGQHVFVRTSRATS